MNVKDIESMVKMIRVFSDIRNPVYSSYRLYRDVLKDLAAKQDIPIRYREMMLEALQAEHAILMKDK